MSAPNLLQGAHRDGIGRYDAIRLGYGTQRAKEQGVVYPRTCPALPSMNQTDDMMRTDVQAILKWEIDAEKRGARNSDDSVLRDGESEESGRVAGS